MDNGYNGFPFPVFRIVSRRSAKHADSFADCRCAEYLRWRWPMRSANEQNRTASMDREYMDRICARHTGSGADHACLLQAVKNILPNFGNEFANLIKASSQVMVIGVAELMFTFNTVSATGRVFTPLLVIAVLHFAMTFTVGRGVHLMEKHFKKADR